MQKENNMKYYLCEDFNMMITKDDYHMMCPLCNNHPSIEIDEILAPVINRFIRQNYNTHFSCSSHFEIKKGRVRVERVTPYISFKPIFINDLIGFDEHIGPDPFGLIPKNLRNNIIPYFDIRPDLEYSKMTNEDHVLNHDYIQLVFGSMNLGLDTVKLGHFTKIKDGERINELDLTWSFDTHYDFYWDKNRNIVGYRPTLYFRCAEITEKPDEFDAKRLHYNYFTDLCMIFKLIEDTIYHYLGDCPISDYRYVPEIVDVDDLEYIRFGASFDKLQKYESIEVDS